MLRTMGNPLMLGGALSVVGIFMIVIIAILLLVVLAMAYIVYCYPQCIIAEKTDVSERWMAYVPVARSIQKTKIAEMPIWTFLFLGRFTPGLLGVLFAVIISPISAMLPGFAIIGLLGSIGIGIMSFGINYLYNYKLCQVFGFKTFLAFVMALIPGYASMFTFLIVYSDKFPADKSKLKEKFNLGNELKKFAGSNTNSMGNNSYNYAPTCNSSASQSGNQNIPRTVNTAVNMTTPVHTNIPENANTSGNMNTPLYNQKIDAANSPIQNPVNRNYGSEMNQKPAPGVICTNGAMKGVQFNLSLGTKLNIGRSPQQCNVVLSQDCIKVSRVHCSVEYDENKGVYIITDYSSNGTYVNGSRISNGTAYEAKPGSVIALGDMQNTFVLK